MIWTPALMWLQQVWRMKNRALFCHADTVNFANTPQNQGRPVPLRAMAPVTKGLGGLRVSGDGTMRADCFRKRTKGQVFRWGRRGSGNMLVSMLKRAWATGVKGERQRSSVGADRCFTAWLRDWTRGRVVHSWCRPRRMNTKQLLPVEFSLNLTPGFRWL